MEGGFGKKELASYLTISHSQRCYRPKAHAVFLCSMVLFDPFNPISLLEGQLLLGKFLFEGVYDKLKMADNHNCLL